MTALRADLRRIDSSEAGVRFSSLGASAAIGGVAWLLVLLGGSTGVIEDLHRFLLLALLVVVPLGLSLCEPGVPTRREFGRVGRLQPIGALFGLVSCALTAGIAAGLLAAAWLLFAMATAYAASPGLARMAIDLRSAPVRCSTVATLYLAVGAAWLTAARFGIEPLGFAEPFVSLTAIHFHYAGFATAAIAGAVVPRTHEPGRTTMWMEAAILGGPPAVAAGFLVSPLARVVAVAFFAAGVIALAVRLLKLASEEKRILSRILLATSGASVLFSISLAIGYAVSEWLGGVYFTVPRMVSVHGWVNALGFTVPGLLGLLMRSGATSK